MLAMHQEGCGGAGGGHGGRRSRSTGTQRTSGFTLIELLVTVAIIGIVAAIAVVNLNNALDKSKQRKTMASMRSLSTALQAYETDNSRYPSDSITLDALQDLLSPDVFNTVQVTDGWGFDLVYSSSGNAYTIESYGRDGLDGPGDIDFMTRAEFDYDLVLADGYFVASPEP